MLMYGQDKPEVLSINFAGEGIVYNLTSLREGYNNFKYIIPPNEIGRLTDRDFDIAFANYILNNDMVFAEFFQIIYQLYMGIDVFIIISDEDWSENMLESLLKLIQQRYGYNAVFIQSDEDYIYARNNMNFDFAPGFGIYNLDQDKERFAYLVETFRLNNKGSLPYNLKWNEVAENGSDYF